MDYPNFVKKSPGNLPVNDDFLYSIFPYIKNGLFLYMDNINMQILNISHILQICLYISAIIYNNITKAKTNYIVKVYIFEVFVISRVRLFFI